MIRTFIVAAIATGLAVSGASAMTVYNADKGKETFVYTPKGGKPHHITLSGNHHRSISCRDGGTLVLGKSTATCTAKTARVWIRNGKFVI